MKTKIMSEIGVLIHTILKMSMGKKSHTPDHKCDKYFHYLSGSVEMFKILNRYTIGIHIPEDENTEGHIFMIHQHFKNVIIAVEENRPHPPDIVITFKIKKDSTILPLLSGEGSRRINMLMFNYGLKEIIFKLLEETTRLTSEYNLRKLKLKERRKK